MTKMSILAVGLWAVGLCSSGCVMWQREPEFYTEQLAELVDGRSEAIAACYDRVLNEDADASGDVTVKFVVAADTGLVNGVEVAKTSGPEAIAGCVTAELSTLRLDPPDVNTAEATFSWEFRPGSPKRPPADPFVGVQPAVLGCYSDYLATVDRNASGQLVIDYAFDRKLGTIERLDVISDGTTAPAPVVECAKQALAGVKFDPARLEDRNAAGRRTFTLKFTPFAG